MGVTRKKDIYAVCVEFGGIHSSLGCPAGYSIAVSDIIIVEDDPYYFLQEGQYQPKNSRNLTRRGQLSAAQFLEDLVPSYLR